MPAAFCFGTGGSLGCCLPIRRRGGGAAGLSPFEGAGPLELFLDLEAGMVFGGTVAGAAGRFAIIAASGGRFEGTEPLASSTRAASSAGIRFLAVTEMPSSSASTAV